MKSQDNAYIISIDPGVSGGIAVFEKQTKKILLFQKNPIQKYKKKSIYDMQEFYNIFSKYKPNEIVSEFVHSMPGEGSTSSFNFGRCSGLIEGLAYGLQTKFLLVTPQKWKKHFKDLITDEMFELKKDLKSSNDKIKQIKQTKNSKDKKEKLKEETKIKNKIQYNYKKLSKRAAREKAIKLYPETDKMLSKSTYDGVADAILIGVYYLEQ